MIASEVSQQGEEAFKAVLGIIETRIEQLFCGAMVSAQDRIRTVISKSLGYVIFKQL